MKISNEAKLGITVFLAAIVFVGGIIYLRGMDFRKKDYRLTIYYGNVNGLTEGSPITIAGLIIGKVEDLRLVGTAIAVDVALSKDVRIARDSKAYIKSASLMGGKQIAITPGRMNETLNNGDTLSGAYEADLTELTSTLAPISSNVLGILERVNTTFDEQTRRNIQLILEDVHKTTKELEGIIRLQGEHIDYAVGNFAVFSTNLSKFAMNLDTIALTQRGNINDGIASLRTAANTLEQASERFKAASESIENVSKKIERGEGTMGKMINDEKLYQHLDSLSVNLNELVKDLKEHPGDRKSVV